MRTLLAAICFIPAAMVAAAHAQTACEASAIGPAGEVIVSYDLSARGSVREVTVNWLPEREDGVGEESDFFARPSLLLEYRMTTEGALEGPGGLHVMVTRFQSPGDGPPPPMSSVRIRVRAPGSTPVTWPANTGAGEAEAAKMLRQTSPPSVTAEVLDMSGAVLAAAEFDLSVLPDVQKLAHHAKSKLELRPQRDAQCTGS